MALRPERLALFEQAVQGSILKRASKPRSRFAFPARGRFGLKGSRYLSKPFKDRS